MSERAGRRRRRELPASANLGPAKLGTRRRRYQKVYSTGFRSLLRKSGFQLRRTRLRPFFDSPSVWLIEPIRAKRATFEGSCGWTLQREWQTRLREAGKGVEGSFQGKTIPDLSRTLVSCQSPEKM